MTKSDIFNKVYKFFWLEKYEILLAFISFKTFFHKLGQAMLFG